MPRYRLKEEDDPDESASVDLSETHGTQSRKPTTKGKEPEPKESTTTKKFFRLPFDDKDYPLEGTWTFKTGQIMKGEFEGGDPVGEGTVSNPIGDPRVYFDSSDAPAGIKVKAGGAPTQRDLAAPRHAEECKRLEDAWKKKEAEHKRLALENKDNKAFYQPPLEPLVKPPAPPQELLYEFPTAYVRWSGNALKANEMKKSGLQSENFELSLEFRTEDENAPLL